MTILPIGRTAGVLTVMPYLAKMKTQINENHINF